MEIKNQKYSLEKCILTYVSYTRLDKAFVYLMWLVPKMQLAG